MTRPASGDYSGPATVPNPTIWAGPVPPRVQRKWHTLRHHQWVRISMGRCRTPAYTVWTSRFDPGPPRVCEPDPWNGIRTPCMGSRPPTVGSQDIAYSGLNQDLGGVRCRHVSRPDLVGSGPYHIHSCSPPRRRPDAATWPTARGVSQRAEPDIKPLGYARLCIYYR
jgi:hypothetical protein